VPSKEKELRELRKIPGVGKKISEDLWRLGIKKISDLKRKNPDRLYAEIFRKQGYRVDRCMLYVFRCAVYYAKHKSHDPLKLRWWNWKA